MVGALLLCAAGGRAAAAQQLQRRIPAVPAVGVGARVHLAVTAPGEWAAAPPRRHSLLVTALYAAGGAVLGGWVGYMTSQIVWSDWQELSRPGVNRMHYTLTGAGIGTLAGAVVGHHVGGGAPAAPPPGRRRSPWGDLPVITAAEVRASRARTAAELIADLHPEWIERRSTDTFGGAAVQTITFEGVAVFLDGEPLGTIADLRAMSVHQVESVEYYDVTAATRRWGAAEFRRIINVITEKGES